MANHPVHVMDGDEAREIRIAWKTHKIVAFIWPKKCNLSANLSPVHSFCQEFK
jgi:hypothetical protein